MISSAARGVSASNTTQPSSRRTVPTKPSTSGSSSQTRILISPSSMIDRSDSMPTDLIGSASAAGSHKSTLVPFPGALVI